MAEQSTLESPYSVVKGSMPLIVQEKSFNVSAAFALIVTMASHRVAIRLTGGCKGMNQKDKENMIAVFTHAFQGYAGVLWSGGTRQTAEDGSVDPMVTDIPGVVAEKNKNCIALGSAPRTDLLQLVGDSRLVLDGWGTAPNPAMDGFMIVQDGPDKKLGWDGDLDMYFSLMEYGRDYAGFTKLGVISWNGGDVTHQEIMTSLQKGWVTILMQGSGRATDEVADALLNKDPSIAVKNPQAVFIVPISQPAQLRSVLEKNGFL